MPIFSPIMVLVVRPLGSVWQAFCSSLLLHVLVLTVLMVKTPVTVRPALPSLTFEMISMPAPAPVSPPTAPRSASEDLPLVPEVPIEPPKSLPLAPKEAVLPLPNRPVPMRRPVKVRQKHLPHPVPADANFTPVATRSETTAAATMPSAPQVDNYQPPDVRATYADNPKPDYPPSARRMGHEGTVWLVVEITEAGWVARVTIKTSSGFDTLDRAATAAVSQWRFVPAQHNGRPTLATVMVPIRFQLQTE